MARGGNEFLMVLFVIQLCYAMLRQVVFTAAIAKRKIIYKISNYQINFSKNNFFEVFENI